MFARAPARNRFEPHAVRFAGNDDLYPESFNCIGHPILGNGTAGGKRAQVERAAACIR